MVCRTGSRLPRPRVFAKLTCNRRNPLRGYPTGVASGRLAQIAAIETMAAALGLAPFVRRQHDVVERDGASEPAIAVDYRDTPNLELLYRGLRTSPMLSSVTHARIGAVMT